MALTYPTGDPYLDEMIVLSGSYGGALAEMGRLATGDPNQKINRVTFAVEMADQLGLDTSNTTTARNKFTDVGGLTPRQLGAISALVDAGIVKGTSGSTFSPADPIQRGHAATMLDRAGIDSTAIFQQGRLGDPLTGNELPYVQQRLPGATIRQPLPAGFVVDPNTAAQDIQAATRPTVGSLRDQRLADLYNPLQDPRFAVYSANAGLSIENYQNSITLAQANATAQIALAAQQMEALIGQAQANMQTSTGIAGRTQSASMQAANLRLSAAREIMQATVARAQGAMQSSIARNDPIFEHERFLSQKKINQDYESRGFYRSGARGSAVAEGKKTIDLAEAASEEAARQQFLNQQTSAQNSLTGAQATYGATQATTSAAYQNAVDAARNAYANARLGYQQSFDTYSQNVQLGFLGTQDQYMQMISEEKQNLALEEIKAIERQQQKALAGV